MYANTLKKNKTTYSYPCFLLLFNCPFIYWQKGFLSYLIGSQFHKKCLMNKVVGRSCWIFTYPFTYFSVVLQIVCCSWFLPPFQKSDRCGKGFYPCICIDQFYALLQYIEICIAQTTLQWNIVSMIWRWKNQKCVCRCWVPI